MANITTYDFIDSNKRKTVLLMILFPIVFVMIVYLAILLFAIFTTPAGTGHPSQSAFMIANQTAIYILPIVSIIAILWLLISYFFGDNFILSVTGSVELTKENAPEVIRMVENIAITAGLPMPKVYAINDESLNAFATGRDPKNASIALTKGIIEKLERSELECVIAHEMAHIGNRDIRLMLIMIVCISFSTIVAELLLRSTLNSSKGDGKGRVFILFLALALYLYGYLLAPLIKLALSRTREFQADATAALITRNPGGLASALEKISKDSIVEILNDKESMAAMWIETPIALEKRNSFFSKISGLFATHPPIEERIKALRTMDGFRE